MYRPTNDTLISHTHTHTENNIADIAVTVVG